LCFWGRPEEKGAGLSDVRLHYVKEGLEKQTCYYNADFFREKRSQTQDHSSAEIPVLEIEKMSSDGEEK
jgi:hypothetical protein